MAPDAGEILLSTFVKGWPRPKGSLKPEIVRGGGGRATGRVRLSEDNPESTVWLRTMAQAFVVARGGILSEQYHGPVAVQGQFWFNASRFGEETQTTEFPIHPHIGDLDKLVRNLLDALQAKTGAGIIKDDRQVASLAKSCKLWAPTGGASGVAVTVWRLT